MPTVIEGLTPETFETALSVADRSTPVRRRLRFAHWLLFYRSERLAQTIADFTFSGSESPKSDILESQLATSLEGRDESASNDEIMPAWCWQIED